VDRVQELRVLRYSGFHSFRLRLAGKDPRAGRDGEDILRKNIVVWFVRSRLRSDIIQARCFQLEAESRLGNPGVKRFATPNF